MTTCRLISGTVQLNRAASGSAPRSVIGAFAGQDHGVPEFAVVVDHHGHVLAAGVCGLRSPPSKPRAHMSACQKRRGLLLSR